MMAAICCRVFVAFICLCLIVQVWCQLHPSLAITMMCRDEEVNFKTNLASWLPIVDYFVFMIDNRTKDNSIETISAILKPARKGYKVIVYNFTGFGTARTLSLQAVWEHFPQASHVLIADPDWVPDVSTMNINDLDDSADVFRFTAYDRNGYTRRRMDWLLKHRQGLAMKYHLHEVLDIGMYSAKNINWEVHEIEKPGSWHTTVGHADSFSAKRYEFDLDLLYKDLSIYGHDPHAHYYLGVTHEAYASKSSQTLGLYHPDVQKNVDKSIEYLELRATTQYIDEFVEQRWAVMLQLGSIFIHMRRNDQKAIYWLSLCRDYNPRQSECSLALCELYVRLGQIEPALKELHGILRQGSEKRAMVEYLNHWECKVPAVVVQLFSIKAQTKGLTSEEAKYFFLMWRMARAERCTPDPVEIDPALASALNKAVGGSRQIDYFTAEEQEVDFCVDLALQQYLLKMEYSVHSCDAVRQAQVFSKTCDIFVSTLPPAYEEFQIASAAKRFVGTAILPDIIHHAYQSRREDVLGGKDPLRFMFAEHFDQAMVYNLVGQLQSLAISTVDEVAVVTPDVSVIQAIRLRLQVCRGQISQQYAKKVVFFLGSVAQYQEQFPHKKFHFIEFNGGISKAADPSQDLVHLHALLREDGVLGATYFSENHLTTRAREMVDARNVVAFIPFSLEATRLVHNFLEQHKLGSFKADRELVTHLGGELEESPHVLYRASELQPRVQWRTYTQQQATDLLAAAGFHIASWVPSAYSHPFDEIEHYSIRKYQDMGISQEDFVREFMVNFRYSVYATKSGSQERRHGRMKLTGDMLAPKHFTGLVANKIHVIDRHGYLSSSFRGMEALAQQRQSTSIEFAHYSLPGDTRFGFIVSPVIAPCMPRLSERPSLQALHDANKQFAARERRDFDETEAVQLLISFLSYLEKLNIITYESSDLASITTDDPPEITKMAYHQSGRVTETPLPAESSSSSPQFRKVGGLKITNRNNGKHPTADNESSLPSSPNQRSAGSGSTSVVEVRSASKIITWQRDENTRLLQEAGFPREQIEQILVSEQKRFQAMNDENAHSQGNAHSLGVVDVLGADRIEIVKYF